MVYLLRQVSTFSLTIVVQILDDNLFLGKKERLRKLKVRNLIVKHAISDVEWYSMLYLKEKKCKLEDVWFVLLI